MFVPMWIFYLMQAISLSVSSIIHYFILFLIWKL